MSGTERVDVRRRAGWLPEQHDLERWIEGHRKRVGSAPVPLAPAVRRFRDLIEGDPVLRMHAHQMIEQVPQGKSYGKRHVEDLDELLQLMNGVLTIAPEFGQDSMVSTPLGAIFDWMSGTPAGFAFFRDPRVNAALREVLTTWCRFLSSPDSLYSLNESDTGWKSDAAKQAVGIEQFQHDSTAEHWGFASWNDYFTRRFRDGERPVAAPDDDRVIAAPCEATPYRIAVDVKRHDEFWAKSESYSLHDMLAGDPSVEQFVGGTVYQAFLSATNYHRWHSPVSGTVVRAWVQPGSYYSEADSQGADAVEPTTSQGYLAHVATRAVILLQADDPAIGLVAFLPIGMEDVSSCVLDPAVQPGAHVNKGDELGYFQFGGSTYCLLFQPDVITGFSLTAIPAPGDPTAPLVPVRSALATARPSVTAVTSHS